MWVDGSRLYTIRLCAVFAAFGASLIYILGPVKWEGFIKKTHKCMYMHMHREKGSGRARKSSWKKL